MNCATAIIHHLLETEEDDDIELTHDLLRGPSAEEEAEMDRQALRDKILAGKFTESQYTLDYLQTNADLGDGQGLTVGSYLSGHLRGAALRKYSRKYKTALEHALERRVYAGLARRGASRLDGIAYYPI